MIIIHSASSTARLTVCLLLMSICVPWISSCVSPVGYLPVSEKRSPFIIDDLPYPELLTALDHHFNYLSKFPENEKVSEQLGSLTYKDLKKSLLTFRAIIERNPSPLELDRLVRKHFSIYQAQGRARGKKNTILLTGYYEPVFEGSLVSQPPFVYPLYSVPQLLVSSKDPVTGKTRVGRRDKHGNLAPFWSRKEIDTTGLLRGEELVYLKDPMDAYLLHVQGSGRIRLQDGSVRSIHYGASNGRKYRSLGKLFVDKNIMALEDVSIPAIRAYFNTHPEDLGRMLNHNPRYIFFKWGDDKGPRGSIGEVLTPGRSVAIDHDTFPTGAIGYLVSRKPLLDDNGSIESWITFSRFVLPQDSGSAIKGAGRVDLFMGNSRYAETAASHMKEEGKFYLLIQNNWELPQKSGTLSLITDIH